MKKLYNAFFLLTLLTLFIIIFTISVSAQFVRVTSDFANIRVTPNPDSKIVGEAFKDDIFRYINEENDWIEIDMFSGVPRYIHLSLVKIIDYGISASFSNNICQRLMKRLEEVKDKSLAESNNSYPLSNSENMEKNIEYQRMLLDRYILDIFHEFDLQPVIYLIAVNRCIEGLESKIGQRLTVEKEKIANEYAEKTEVKEPVKNKSPWYEIARWQGKSIKNTETFHIPSHEWRISWKTEPGEYGDMNFQIYVYETSSSIPGIAANVIGYDMDSSIMRGAGDYYLTINSAQPYIIIVEAKHEQKPVEKEKKEEKVQTGTGWHEIARWQGKSIKNTETFHIPSHEWRISWKTEPGEYGDMNFQIYVYETSSSIPGIAANVIGYDMDSSIMRGAGDYYLTINSAQPYIIIVEAKN